MERCKRAVGLCSFAARISSNVRAELIPMRLMPALTAQAFLALLASAMAI